MPDRSTIVERLSGHSWVLHNRRTINESQVFGRVSYYHYWSIVSLVVAKA
jgi:hypothetical protein